MNKDIDITYINLKIKILELNKKYLGKKIITYRVYNKKIKKLEKEVNNILSEFKKRRAKKKYLNNQMNIN